MSNRSRGSKKQQKESKGNSREWFERLSDPELLLEDLPPLVQDITWAYVEEHGYLDELEGSCGDIVARVLEQVVQERLEALFSEKGDSPQIPGLFEEKVQEAACLAQV